MDLKLLRNRRTMSTMPNDHDQMQRAAKDHLWMHFSRHTDADIPVIVRGEGVYIYDDQGKRYLDALAGLFVSQLGHGRADLAEVLPTVEHRAVAEDRGGHG